MPQWQERRNIMMMGDESRTRGAKAKQTYTHTTVVMRAATATINTSRPTTLCQAQQPNLTPMHQRSTGMKVENTTKENRGNKSKQEEEARHRYTQNELKLRFNHRHQEHPTTHKQAPRGEKEKSHDKKQLTTILFTRDISHLFLGFLRRSTRRRHRRRDRSSGRTLLTTAMQLRAFVVTPMGQVVSQTLGQGTHGHRRIP